MSYGIEVINNSGITIIDSDYSNYVILASGTVTGTGSGWDWNFAIEMPDIVGVQLYIRCPGTLGGYYVSNWGGVKPATWVNIVGLTEHNTLHYVIVVPSSAVAAPSSGYGLNIYRADGSLAFASQYNYMVLGASITFEYTEGSADITVLGNAYMCASVLTVTGTWAYNYNMFGDCGSAEKVYASGNSYLQGAQNGSIFSFGQINTMAPPVTPCSSSEVWLYNNVTVPFLIL